MYEATELSLLPSSGFNSPLVGITNSVVLRMYVYVYGIFNLSTIYVLALAISLNLVLQGIGTSLNCPLTEDIVENNVEITRVTCSIGNPLAGPGVTLQVSTTLIPRASLVGNEGMISVSFSVTSVNSEIGTVDDNMVTGAVEVNAVADITLDAQG